jgi:hypothetical protein
MDEILRDALRQEVSEAVSSLDGLEERVIAELGDRRPRLRMADWMRLLTAPTRGARIGQLVVVGATAAAFLVVGLFASRFIEQQTEPVDSGIRLESAMEAGSGFQDVLFVVPAPLNATSVVVVGDFNDWEATPLTDKDGDGIWTTTIPLSPGRYEYGYLIDGKWWGEDPRADDHIQSFGELSSVLYIGRGGGGA